MTRICLSLQHLLVRLCQESDCVSSLYLCFCKRRQDRSPKRPQMYQTDSINTRPLAPSKGSFHPQHFYPSISQSCPLPVQEGAAVRPTVVMTTNKTTQTIRRVQALSSKTLGHNHHLDRHLGFCQPDLGMIQLRPKDSGSPKTISRLSVLPLSNQLDVKAPPHASQLIPNLHFLHLSQVSPILPSCMWRFKMLTENFRS